MAVIHDLSTELLYLIFELAVDFDVDPNERRHLLRRTSLVARAWTSPSIEALGARIMLEEHNTAYQARLSHLQQQAALVGGGSAVRQLFLVFRTSQALRQLRTIKGISNRICRLRAALGCVGNRAQDVGR